MPATRPGELGGLSAMTASLGDLVSAKSLAFQRGSGSLAVDSVAGLSAVTSTWAASPLKLLVPRPRGPSVWAYVSSFGGGLVAGDETSLTVDLADGTRCFLGTQASTKVYRNPAGLPCGHRLEATIGADSLLVAAPDPVQAFAGSHYEQRQTFHLAATGNLVLVDWLCSGRAARGERWAFTQYRSRNEVFVDGDRWLLDSLRLDSDTGPLDGEFRLGRFNCLATIFLVGPAVSGAATAWLREMEAAPVTRRPNFLCSASVVRQGVLVRMGGESVEAVGHEIHRRLKFLSNLLHDDPWARKW